MAKRRGRRSQLSLIPVAALQAELTRRQSQLGSLIAQHAELSKRFESVASEIEALGGSVTGTGRAQRDSRPDRAPSNGSGTRRRPRNATNLAESLVEVLRGKTLSVTDAAEAVQKAGYKTTSANFRVIVNQHLIKGPPFKRVGRGVYTAK